MRLFFQAAEVSESPTQSLITLRAITEDQAVDLDLKNTSSCYGSRFSLIKIKDKIVFISFLFVQLSRSILTVASI